MNVTVAGADVAQSRVEVMDSAGRVVSILIPDATWQGEHRSAAPGDYTVTAGVPGRLSNVATVIVPVLWIGGHHGDDPGGAQADA